MKYVHTFDQYDDLYTYFDHANIKEGQKVLVYSRESERNGSNPTYYLSTKYAEGGYPGNFNPNALRYHGWRGTTNGIATYAYGVYTVKKVEKAHYIKDGFCIDTVKITLNRKDLKKDED